MKFFYRRTNKNNKVKGKNQSITINKGIKPLSRSDFRVPRYVVDLRYLKLLILVDQISLKY